MKKLLIFALVLVGAYMVACNKSAVSPDAVSAQTANATAGGSNNADSVAISTLPTTITTYISKNYAGSTIKRAMKDKAGDYMVLILVNTMPKSLLFNASGTFVKELTAPAPRGGFRKDSLRKDTLRKGLTDSIAVSALPVAITSYIAKNYATAVIKHAEKEGDGTYTVNILVGTTAKILVFDTKGAFVKVITLPSTTKIDSIITHVDSLLKKKLDSLMKNPGKRHH